MTEAPGLSPATANVARPMRPITVAWLIALLGWTVLLCFYDQAGGANFEPIDCWVAQTAREMLEADDWLVPRFSGETRMQKSPGPYWAVMITSVVRGQPIDEISARIPSALAAVLLVLTIFWLTRRIAGDRAAVFAGFASSASVLVLWWSHRGASDLGLTTFTTVSLATLWVATEREPPGIKRNILFLVGYFAAGMGMLYKMPMPLAVVGVPAVLYVIVCNRWRVFLHPIHLLGVVCFLLPWVPWAIAVSVFEEAALYKWKVEFFDRFTGDLPNVHGQGGWENLAFYLPVPLLYCLPFTLSLPGALARVFRRDESTNQNGMFFLILWFAGLLAFFTASTGKEYRYFLPALPPLFALLGIELAAFFDPARRSRPVLDWIGTILVWLVVPGAFIVGGIVGLPLWWRERGAYELLGQYAYLDVLSAYVITASILTVGFGLAAWLYRRRSEHSSFGVMVATMFLMWMYAWPNLVPYFLSQRPFVDFAEQLRERVPRELHSSLRSAATQDSRIIWFSDVRIPRVIDQLELLEEQDGTRDLEYEKRRVGEEMIDLLAGDEPALIVASVPDYLLFQVKAREELAERDRTMPTSYLWIQARYGRLDRQYVVFGNRPPPFREPALRLPEKQYHMLQDRGVDIPLRVERPRHITPPDPDPDVSDEP